MISTLLTAVRVCVVTLVVTGFAYPLAVTGLAQLAFPVQANGSLLRNDRGAVIGSSLIGQAFVRPEYFQGRPSAAGNGYDAASSGGSNWGPTSLKLKARVQGHAAKLMRENPNAAPGIPNDLVATSASGLDPHISPEAADWQIPRVAKHRGISEDRVRRVVEAHTEERSWFVLGERRVNVLLLNLAMDRQFGAP